jgi:hypothetical protein
MEIPAELLRFVTETAEDALKFDGDEAELAHRARNADVTAIKELSSAYRAIAVLTALRYGRYGCQRQSWARGDART